jgi:hypothetical protein
METPKTKICSLCKESKPLEAFGKNHTLKDGKMSACKACISIKNKAKYAKFKAKYAPMFAAYRANNREKNITYAKVYRKNKRHKTPASARSLTLAKLRYRARKLHLPDTWTQEQLTFMLDYWHHACAVCGNPKGLFWTLAHDHWIAITSPDCPGTVATNMIPLCHGDGGCNNSKKATDPHEWLLRRFGPKKAAKIEKAIAVYFAQVALVFADQAS